MRSIVFCLGAWLAMGPAQADSAIANPAASPHPAAGITRVEPPHWWTGLNETRLQILIYGPSVGEAEVSIDAAQVRSVSVDRVDNPNYVFLNLDLTESAQPGSIPITLTGSDGSKSRIDYNLKARAPGSAEREGFSSKDAIYLITPDRFANGDPSNDAVEGFLDSPNRGHRLGRHGGDLAGIRENLDYIADLGFTQIWLNPILTTNQKLFSYHGYATTDLYDVDARYGTLNDYKALVEAAQERGLGVIQDMIVNHVGLNHWLAQDPPSADWFNEAQSLTDADNAPLTNHLHNAAVNPYASEADKAAFTDGWFVPTMPDLNGRNPQLARYLIQNAIWWIEEVGLSGIRMDTYSYSDPEFLAQWSSAIMAEYPNFNIVGEEWNFDPGLVSYWQRNPERTDGYPSGLPSLMDFPLFNVIATGFGEEEDFFDNKGLIALYRILLGDRLYADPLNLVIFTNNHDTDRVMRRLGDDFDAYRMAMVYLATMRGVPQVFYGDELAMSHSEHDHGLIRSDFPGGWTGDTVNGFTGEGLSERQQAAQTLIRRLYTWRKTQPAIHTGALLHFAPGPDHPVYTYFRHDDDSLIMVMFNKSDEPMTVDMARFAEILPADATGTDVLTGKSWRLSGPQSVSPRSANLIMVDQAARP